MIADGLEQGWGVRQEGKTGESGRKVRQGDRGGERQGAPYQQTGRPQSEPAAAPNLLQAAA